MSSGIAQIHRTRLEVEDFLYHEAALLDGWQLDDWTELFTDDAEHIVPATDDPTGTPRLHSCSSSTTCSGSRRGRTASTAAMRTASSRGRARAA